MKAGKPIAIALTNCEPANKLRSRFKKVSIESKLRLTSNLFSQVQNAFNDDKLYALCKWFYYTTQHFRVRLRTQTSANTRPYYTRLSPPDRALRKTLSKAYILGKNYVVNVYFFKNKDLTRKNTQPYYTTFRWITSLYNSYV